MNKNLIKLQVAVCLVLVIILMLEWIFLGSAENPISAGSVSGEEEVSEVALPEIQFSVQALETYSDMGDRPLFIEGRRPVTEEEEETDSLEVENVDDLILMGIYRVEGQMTAMFSRSGSDKTYLKKIQGDDISGWLLKEIRSDNVLLERDGKLQTLMLRKPKLQPASPPIPIKRPEKIIPKS